MARDGLGRWWALVPSGKLMVFGVGYSGNVGDTVGEATIMDAKAADDACTGNFESAGPGNNSDVYQLLTPGDDISGGERFALYLPHGDLTLAQIWRFSEPMGYAKCSKVDYNALPGALKKKSKQGAAAAAATTPSNTGLYIALAVGATALVGGGIYLATKKPHMLRRAVEAAAKENPRLRGRNLRRRAA
jgi:hypothetical protein